MLYFLYLPFITHSYFWLIAAIILGVSLISLLEMAELTITYEDAFSRLFNLVGLTPFIELAKKANGTHGQVTHQITQEEVKETSFKQQPTNLGEIDWSEYSPQILADISEVRYLFQSSLNSETGEINNIRLLNEGMKKANEFIIKHWFELKDEDRQMFEVVAVKLVEWYQKLLKKGRWGVYLFGIYFIIKTILSYFIAKLLYKLGLKKQISRPPIRFSKEFRSIVFKSYQGPKTNNLIIKYINYQTILVNTILRLSGRYDLIDESLYVPEALDKVEPNVENEDLPWEDHMILSSAYIRRQAALFDALSKKQLLAYKGQYVFFEEGEIKDHDTNHKDLIDRVYENIGYRAIFIEKVE